MPTFHLVRIAEPGSPVLRDAFDQPYTFSDGQEAAQEAKRLGKQLGLKLSAKVVIDRRWRNREQQRFDDGSYIQLPWRGADWWYDSRLRCPDIDNIHFAHVSQKQAGMIAYTASEEDGSKDKQTVIKPTKYLKRFCAKSLASYRLDPRSVAAKFAAQFAPVKLKFAETAKDIQRVYEQGPESCMSHSISSYVTRHQNVHPVTVYAAGDLQVAYLEAVPDDDDDDDDEKLPLRASNPVVVARAIVWPEKKTHSRIYGDIHRMQAALKNAGYAFGAPEGAKLKRIKLYGHNDRFVAPYIDASTSSGGGSLAVFDENTHLVICRKDPKKEYFACSLTEGCTTRGTRGIQCTHCEEHAEADNVYHVRLSVEAEDYRVVCSSCASDNEYYWRNSLDRNIYDYEVCQPVEMDDGALWNTEQFAQNGAVCSLSGLNCDRSHMVQMHNGVMWSRHSWRHHGFTCEGNGKKYPLSEMVRTVSGRAISREFAKSRCFQCEQCEQFEAIGKRTELDGACICSACDFNRQRASLTKAAPTSVKITTSATAASGRYITF